MEIRTVTVEEACRVLQARRLEGEDGNRSTADALQVPVIPHLDAEILAAVEGPQAYGKFDMGDWHYCHTTHCRAGWAVVIAGKHGMRLERLVGAEHAGALIYHASTGRIPDFYADTDEALADIRACATGEKAARP